MVECRRTFLTFLRKIRTADRRHRISFSTRGPRFTHINDHFILQMYILAKSMPLSYFAISLFPLVISWFRCLQTALLLSPTNWMHFGVNDSVTFLCFKNENIMEGLLLQPEGIHLCIYCSVVIAEVQTEVSMVTHVNHDLHDVPSREVTITEFL